MAAKRRRIRGNKKIPVLRPLAYGSPWCELCTSTIAVGQLVAWWPVACRDGGKRMTAYCATCHYRNVRHGGPLR